MGSLNKCMFIGNVGKDPVSRNTKNDTLVVNFSMAVSNGQKGEKEITEWVNVTAFDKLAKAVLTYVGKGSSVFVEGSMRTTSYMKEGVKVYATGITAYSVQFLTLKPPASAEEQVEPGPTDEEYVAAGGVLDEDDVPF